MSLTSLQQAITAQGRARYRWLNGLLAVVLALISLTALPPPVARAAIRTVPAGGSLQTAVNQSLPGDVIRLAGNTLPNETVNLALMGSSVGGGPGNLTIVGVNSAGLTLLGGNGSRIIYDSATPFPGTLAFDGVTFSTSASTPTPAVSLQNMGSLIFSNVLFDGVGAEGCNNGVNGCTGLYVSVSSGSPVIGIYSSTFRNIASDAINIDVQGTAQASIVVNTSVIEDNTVNSAVPNTGVQVFTSGSATANLTVAQTRFESLQGRAVYANAAGSSILSTSVVSSTILNLTDNNLGAITLSTEAAATSPTLNAIIADNEISNVLATGILGLFQSTGPSTAMNLQIRGNGISNVDITSPSRRGILVEALPTYTASGVRGSLNAKIENNRISSTGGSGIQLRVDDVNVASSIRSNQLSDNNRGGSDYDGAIAAYVGNNNFDGDPFALSTAIVGNTVGATGIYLESVYNTPIRVESTGDVETFIETSNGTQATLAGVVTGIALNSVARPPENFVPGAFSDFFTVPNTSASVLPVMADDRDYDFGDVISLHGFQAVSIRGGVITRNDNGTPGNQADDQLNYTPPPSQTGIDRFFYVVRDIGGRLSINVVVLNMVADSTPPDTTISIFPGNPSNDNTPTFQFTGIDNVTAPASLTFQCRLYLASATPPAFASCTSPFTSAALPDGTYIFQVRARDQVGNIDPTPAQYTWQIDTTGPTVTINTGPTNPTNSTSANFTFSATDGTGTGVAAFSCSLDGALFSACTSPQPFTGLADGSHTFRVRAIDNAGNTGAIASFTWVIDTVPPETTITANPTAVSNSSTATFQFTGNTLGGTAIASFECQLDGGGFAACVSPRVYSGLADGSHTFEVRAIDAAGNVDATPAIFIWVVDTTAPPAPVVLTPANGSVTNNPQPPVTGTAEPGSTVNIFIDGSVAGNTTADGSGNWSFTPTVPLANGSHTVRARAFDAAGNSSVDSNTNTFTVDTVEPDTTLTATPPAASNSTSAAFEFTGSGTGSGIDRFECSLDGAAFATCTSPQNLSGLTEGSHTFRVRAVDQAGNIDTTPASYTWIVDLTAPDTTITGNPPALSNSANATFSFTGTDPTSGGVASGVALFECSVDGGGFVACANGVNVTGLPDGSHTFAVRAIDNAGNVDASPATYTWTIDTTPPAAPVVLTPANGSVTNNPLPPVNGTAEPGSTVTVLIDGSSVGTTTADGAGNWSFTLTVPLANGSHTVRVRASDAAGNSSVDSNTNTFVVDTVEPDTTFTTTPPAATNSTSANFVFIGSGTGSAVARFECSLDGAAFATCTSPQNLSGLAEGSHTFQARAVDAAGNVDSTPASYTWIIDLTPADTTITGSPPALSNSASATFSFTGTDPTSGGVASGVASFECSLDGGAFSACASGLTLTGLADGSHTFEVRAIDNAGNVDASPASYTWTIDTTVPAAPVVNNPANGSVTNNPLPPVTGTAEPASTVTVYLNGNPLGTTTVDGSGNWSYTLPSALADGTYTVRARASDAAGNTSVDSNTNTFVVDTVEPDTTFTATPPAITNSTSASFTFTGSGTGSAVARFECSLDGAAFATCASPQNLIGLAEGNHTFAVRAVDAAGNVDASPASYSWAVDVTAPDTTITAAPPALSNDATPTFSFTGNDPTSGGVASGVASFECSLDGAPFSACTSPLNLAALADGPHTFAVRAIDNAGNVDASPATHAWTIDTTAPAAPVVLTPANGLVTTNNQPPVTGTAEPGSTVEVVIDGTSIGTTTADGSGNWSLTPTALPDGAHTVKATTSDAAGNTSPDSNTNSFTVDTQAPDTTLTATPPAASSSTSASFSFTGSDGSGSGVALFECSLDGGPFTTCTSPQAYSGLADGSHTFAVRAIDNAGNLDATPATYTWQVDTVAPDTTITSSPPAISNVATASFSFTGNDGIGSGVALFECSLDGAAFSACTSPQAYSGLADGSHTFAVRAIDNAGNADATPAAYTWTIDTTVLAVTVEQAAGQADPTGVAPIVFTVTFNKPVADFDSTDVDLSGSTAPGTLSASVIGSGTTYTVTVSGMTGPGAVSASLPAGRATDVSGTANQASTSVDNTVTFNPTTPTVTGIVRGSFNPTNAATVVFTVTLSEDVSGLDSADFALAAGTGLTGASITGVTGSGTTYIVTVSTGSGSGTLGLNLVDDDSVRGVSSGVPLGGAGAGNGNFTGEVYTVDRIPPTGSLQPLAPVVKGSAFYTFTVVYTDNVAVKFSTIDSNDIRVTRPGGFSVLAELVSATPAADGTPIQATYRFTPPSGSWRNQDNGPYTLTLVAGQITDTAGNSNVAKELGRLIVNVNAQVFLPIVNLRMPLPDLVVEQVRFTGTSIEVVVHNQGRIPVSDAFWVDLYIAPRSAPTAVNQTWQTNGDSGITWGVTAGGLPIPPNGRLTLRVGDQFFRADQSRYAATIPAGTPIYAQVDSANALTTYGGVLESHERDGAAYNNIASATVSGGGVTLPLLDTAGQARTDERLPKRK
ncbi:MAG TPA: Ig-like domain-containing protein [Roseiflexaceae bacterium]|nr:Ig-like domain-containing protein [Roseiflexaceae bacterium]